ncbi:MAG: phosphotransferase, partial [Myxococcota bacterium]|nr:phosphotransferase [Myxococcota bacterium]
MGKTDTDAPELKAEITKQFGRAPSQLERIPAGLGHRHFFRVHFEDGHRPQSVIARIEPSGTRLDLAGQEPALEPIRAFLEEAGLPVPRSHADGEHIQLLEDLGDESLEKLALRVGPSHASEYYAEACALIPRLQNLTPPSTDHVEAFHRQWDRDLVASKAQKWLDWSFPLIQGRPAEAAERKALSQAFDSIAERCRKAPLRLAHRDFKAANLHRRPDSKENEWVMIDLQGAFLAPPEYDLVCLLRDAHVALPESQVDTHLREIRLELPDRPDEESFMDRFDLITLTRVSKDLSHYLHAATHRGDRRYLAYVPQALLNLKTAARRLTAPGSDLSPLLEAIETLPARVEV